MSRRALDLLTPFRHLLGLAIWREVGVGGGSEGVVFVALDTTSSK